ncbi:NOL1/NOP2/sun family putative RNA methylase [Candidatus Peregrinibacteria bacterium]|nr:MAG: NOL1/NOP2/sun family putative RNA methylase [Candidatus Peregrinibacteria bacterium]
MKDATGPLAFWNRYQKILGNDFDAFYAAQHASLPKTLRVNTLRNTVPEFLEWAKKYHPDWKLTSHPFSSEIFLIDRDQRHHPLGKNLGHIQGRFYIQEASSALPPLALKVVPGQRVLDIASAPGSKSTQIAGLLQAQGSLFSNEFSGSRIKVLAANLQRCGVPNAIVSHLSGERFGNLLPEYFDRILVDAPCTGEGTFRKDRNALLNWSLQRILAAGKLQKSLLRSAFQALKPYGILVYSTCTLAPEENEGVLRSLLAEFGDAVEICDLSGLFLEAHRAQGLSEFVSEQFSFAPKVLRVWPHLFNSEGFFVAAIRKTESLRNSKHLPPLRKERAGSLQILPEKHSQEIQKAFSSAFQFSLPPHILIAERKGFLWGIPQGAEDAMPLLSPDRPGILLGKMHRNKLRISHECAVAFGVHFSGNLVLECSAEEARAFLRGENLVSPPHLPEKADILLRFQGLPLGLTRKVEGSLKNNLPRNFLMEDVH